MYQHFIITRFNLRKDNWNISDTWMDSRLELFENYCYASVKSQKEERFSWLVFFDINTSEMHRVLIKRLANEYANFHPIYIDGMDNLMPEIIKEIKDRLTEPYLITSRLDNDDSLHQDYTREVQGCFESQDFLAIDYVDGYTLKVSPCIKFGYRSHVNNPFISLIERAENFVTVYSRKHAAWGEEPRVMHIRKKRLWMSIIHEENKENVYLGYGRVKYPSINEFNFKKSSIDIDVAIRIFNVAACFEDVKNRIKTLWKVTFKLLKYKLVF